MEVLFLPSTIFLLKIWRTNAIFLKTVEKAEKVEGISVKYRCVEKISGIFLIFPPEFFSTEINL